MRSDPVYSEGAPVHPGCSARTERGSARRVAAVRLPRIQPHRPPARRARRQLEADDQTVVLRDSGQRRTAQACPRHRASQPRSTCRAPRPPTRNARRWRRACATCCGGLKRVAMEYSPGNAIPYISRVDAGTVEAVQHLNVDVASSGDLVQRFEAVWSDEAYATHRARLRAAVPHQGSAFELIRDAARGRAGAYRDRHPAGNAGLVQGRRARHGLRPSRRGRRRTPATLTTDRSRPATSNTGERGRAAGFVGQAAPSPARCLLTSRGWGLQVRPCRTEYARAFAAARDGRNAAIALVTERVARDARSAGSKWIARAAT